MILKTLIAVLVVFGMLVGWIAVQHLARRFAARHPELGPAREEGSGCGFPCGAKKGGSCFFKRIGLCRGPNDDGPSD